MSWSSEQTKLKQTDPERYAQFRAKKNKVWEQIKSNPERHEKYKARKRRVWRSKGARPRKIVGRIKLRFLALQRDGFQCRYCGRKPPEVILEVDHVFPKSKGGIDGLENYKTACRECNAGKADVILTI